LLVDVIHRPDRPLGGVLRIDKPPSQMAPEQCAITAAQKALCAKRLSLAEHWIRKPAQLPKCAATGVEGLRIGSDQSIGIGVVEYFCVSLVAAHDAALPQKNNPHACTV